MKTVKYLKQQDTNEINIYLVMDPALFINKRFALNEMLQWNASKFATFYV